MSSLFKPRCLQKIAPKEYGHSAQGFLLPCCWMENYYSNLDDAEEQLGAVHTNLFKEHLHLSNFESIEEVLLTDEWIEFFKSLDDYNTAPTMCKNRCTRNRTKAQI